jgi:tRNA 2-thiouridine synthesizing protein A
MDNLWPDVEVLDLRGLKCPLPALKTSKALARMIAGARLVVWTTDPMSAIDIPHAVGVAAGRVVSMERDGRMLAFRIEV